MNIEIIGYVKGKKQYCLKGKSIGLSFRLIPKDDKRINVRVSCWGEETVKTIQEAPKKTPVFVKGKLVCHREAENQGKYVLLVEALEIRVLKKRCCKKSKNGFRFQGGRPFRHNNSSCYEPTFPDKIDELYLQDDYERFAVKKSEKETKTQHGLALKGIFDSRESLSDSKDFSNLDSLFDVNDEFDVSDETEDSPEELLKDLLKSLEKPEESEELEEESGESEELEKSCLDEKPEEPKNETHQERERYEFSESLLAELDVGLEEITIETEKKINEIAGDLVSSSVILTGKPGVGKTTLVRALAKKLRELEQKDGNSLDELSLLKGHKIMELRVNHLEAGTRYRGDFEERLEKIIDYLKKHPEVILFIDEVHTLIGAGGSPGEPLNANNSLKPFLNDNEIKIIGATTEDEYERYILMDKAFARRFTKISVQEPTVEQTRKILQALLNKGISFRCSRDLVIKEASDRAIDVLLRVSELQKDLYFPDKAIKLLRKGAVKALIRKSSRIELTDILLVLRELKLVPEIILSVLSGEKAEELNIQENSENNTQENQEDKVRVLTCDEGINLIRRKLQERYRRFFQGINDENNDRALKICLFSENPSRFASRLATSIYDSEENLKEFEEIQNKNQVFKVLLFRNVCKSSDEEKQILLAASSERFSHCVFVIHYESEFLNRTKQIGFKILPTNETPPDREKAIRSYVKAPKAFDAIIND